MSTIHTEDHKSSRKRFARNCRRELRNNARFFERIIFSDECKFSLCENLNKQNCRIWGSEHPNEVYETLQNSPSITLWCALSRNEMIRPYFFENENVTGRTYKRMLRYFLLPMLEGYSEDLIFQQYGTLPHYSIEVRDYLNRKQANQWMGWGGPIPLPSRGALSTINQDYLRKIYKNVREHLTNWSISPLSALHKHTWMLQKRSKELKKLYISK